MVIDIRTGLELNPVTQLFKTVTAAHKAHDNPHARRLQAVNNTGQENDGAQAPIGVAQAVAAAESLNDFAQRVERDLHFSVRETSGKVIIEVVNPKTDETIRYIPPEEMLKLAEFLDQALDMASTGMVEKA